jgi:hypothetical protein
LPGHVVGTERQRAVLLTGLHPGRTVQIDPAGMTARTPGAKDHYSQNNPKSFHINGTVHHLEHLFSSTSLVGPNYMFVFYEEIKKVVLRP